MIIPPFAHRAQLEGGSIDATAHMYVLGIDFGHLHDRGIVEDEEGEPLPEKWSVKLNSGMMTVAPAWRVAEVLRTEEFVEVRRRRDEAWVIEQADRDHGEVDVLTDEEPSSRGD